MASGSQASCLDFNVTQQVRLKQLGVQDAQGASEEPIAGSSDADSASALHDIVVNELRAGQPTSRQEKSCGQLPSGK